VTDQASDAEPGARFDPEAAAACVVGVLRPQADADRAAQTRRYLKSDLEFLGVSVPAIRQAVTEKARNYVAAWTGRHLDRMSGVTFPEAVRRLPAKQAAPLRATYQNRVRVKGAVP
jgi:DNA alkylation repair enzyme